MAAVTVTTTAFVFVSADVAMETNYGFQSGLPLSTSLTSTSSGAVDSASYGGSLLYDPNDGLIYITGATYWSYWDMAASSTTSSSTGTGTSGSGSGSPFYLKKSDCFLGVFEPRNNKSSLKLVFAERFGSNNVPEACSAIALVNNGNSNNANESVGVVTAGHTPNGGFLTSSRPLGSLKSTMYGFVLKINLMYSKWTSVTANNDGSSAISQGIKSVSREHDGGILLNDMATQYPAAVASVPKKRSEIYLVSLASTYDNENNYSGPRDVYRPDWTRAAVEYPDYGKKFSIVLQKIQKRDQDEMDYEQNEIDLFGEGSGISGGVGGEGIGTTLKSSWGKVFSLDDHTLSSSTSSRMLNENDDLTFDNSFLRVADLKYIPNGGDGDGDGDGDDGDALILAGTTNGDGEAFGGSRNHETMTKSIRKTHGFVTKLNLDGEIIKSVPIHVNGESVSIKGICYDASSSTDNDNGNDNVHLYVVGETTGHLDTNMDVHDLSHTSSGKRSQHAFISKINFDTLEVMWSRQLGSTNGGDVTGQSCAVNLVNDIVYLVGDVHVNGDGNGDSLKVLSKDSRDSDGRVRASSAGGRDVFVAIYGAGSGETNVIRQFGTSEDDSVAGGNAVAVDGSGNAILLGNTRGSMVRWRGDGALSVDEDPSDVFVVSISRETGDTVPIAEFTKGAGGGGGDGDDDDELNNGGGGGGQAGGKGFGLAGFEVVAITVASTIVFATLLYIGLVTIDASNGGTMGRGNSERIIEYVKDFEDDEVTLHIRHSATGGVHGIYSPQKKQKNDSSRSLQEQSSLGVNQTYFTYDQEPTDNKNNNNNHSKQVTFKEDTDKKKRRMSQEDEKLHTALDSVEADFSFRNNQTMVQHINKEEKVPREQQQKPAATAKINSTPLFDGTENSANFNSSINDVEGNFGLNHRRTANSTPMPPPQAFQVSDDVNSKDDEWETEIL